MERNLVAKLNLVYGVGARPDTPTPVQILEAVKANREAVDWNSEMGIDLTRQIIDRFTSKKGGLMGDQIKKFKISLERLRERYEPRELSLLDETCIRKNGSVNEKKFKKRLTQVEK
jgi:hypothetical protein